MKKLYVWENVLEDYTPGMMVALADNVKDAKRILKQIDPNIPEEDLARTPEIVDLSNPETIGAWVVWGGG
jgi:hypothetical protein